MGEHDSRKSLALVALVVLSVAAIAMSAATVANVEGASGTGDGRPLAPVDPGGGGGGPANETPGNGSEQVLVGNSSNRRTELQLRGCNDLLSSTPGTLGYFAGLVAVLYLIKRRFSFGFTMLAGYAITPIALAVYFLRTQCGGTGQAISDNTLGGGNGTAGPANPVANVPPVFLIGGFAVLFVGVAAVLYFSTGSRQYEPEDERDHEEEADVEDIAAAARAAAERLESRDADVDNEVYRAWWEMTQLLNVSSPETFTPGQFAEAAVEVGIDREHVDALTTLFEEVRYGHRDPESREERAIEVFRQIEQYGEQADGIDSEDADVSGSDGDRTDGHHPEDDE